MLASLALLGLTTAANWAPQEEAHQEQKGEEDALHEAMERTEDGMRALRRALRASESAPGALAALGEVRAGLVLALGLVPEMPPQADSALARAQHRIAYQRKLMETLECALQIEEAVLAGAMERARERFEVLHQHEKSGHEAFQGEDDH